MLEMKCPACGAPVNIVGEEHDTNGFSYYVFDCTVCEYQSEFAIRSIQNEPEH